MPKVKLPKTIHQEAEKYVEMSEEARTKTNAANRQKTALKNAVKSHWLKESLPIGSYVRAAGHEFRYQGAESTTYDITAIVDAYEAEEITREQFERLIKIDPKQLANVFGADQAADLTMNSVGDTIDIRISSLSVEDEDDEFIMVERNIRKKQKRSVFGKRKTDQQSNSKTTKTLKRKVKVRRHD